MDESQWLSFLSKSSRVSADAFLNATPPKPARNLNICIEETIQIFNKEAHTNYLAVRTFGSPPPSPSGSPPPEPEVENHGIKLGEKLTPSQFFHKFVAKTEEQCLEEALAPQKSKAWLENRRLSLTASQFGSAAGLSPYQTPDELLNEKLWDSFEGNAATRWGSDHEVHAQETFKEWFYEYAASQNFTDVVFTEPNLLKFQAEPWLAVSPDGIVTYTDKEGTRCTQLIEYKCPFYLRNTKVHPYSKHSVNTPPQYDAQIQGIMGYLNSHKSQEPLFSSCWFVVWQPRITWITLRAFNSQFYSDLHDKLESWYFTRFLPALTLRHNGELPHGQIDRSCAILCD